PNGDIDVNADYRLDIPFDFLNSPLQFKNYDSTRAPVGTGPGSNPRGVSSQPDPKTTLQVAAVPHIILTTRVSQINGDACSVAGSYSFSLSKQAKVTLSL